jgi:hypothetical protein
MPAKYPTRRSLGAYLAALSAFAIAMGHLEGVVVVYIRHLMDIVPMPEHLTAEVMAQVPAWLIATEQGREAATIIMLVTLAWLAGRGPLERLATFLFAFGVWDITYYVSLKVLLDWPASLQTMDCLFLIPNPWFAPVWMPVSASAVMIVLALTLLAAPRRRVP